MEKITLTLTNNQANIILQALENEAIDDPNSFGYSYQRCYNDLIKKIGKAN